MPMKKQKADTTARRPARSAEDSIYEEAVGSARRKLRDAMAPVGKAVAGGKPKKKGT